MKTLKIILIAMSLTIGKNVLAQSCNVISDNYSNANLWTYVNYSNSIELKINSGKMQYISSNDGKEERVYRSFSNIISKNDDWISEVNFKPTQGGSRGLSGHIPLAITAGNLDPFANCMDPTNCGPNHNYKNQNQDAYIVFSGQQ